MKTRFKGLVFGLLAGFLGMFLVGMMVTRNLALEGTYTYLKLFNEVISLIRNSYVDEVNTDSLMEGAYEGMLAELDPFSEYLTEDEYREYVEYSKKSQARERADTGMRVARKSGVLMVVSVKPGSAAEAQGITPGDRIRRIGDQSTYRMNLFTAESMLSGKEGGKVFVAIAQREGGNKIETELRFDRTPLPEVRLDIPDSGEGIGVITIPHFERGVSNRLRSLLEETADVGVNRLLIDLRGNAWGEIDEAVRAGGLFLGGKVIARLEGRGEEPREYLGGRAKPAFVGLVMILMDRSTAAAAELFAAALRDGGGSLVGETTFGVGAEQDLLPLKNGGYLKLSVKKYVSPDGTAWHGVGLAPAKRMVVSQQNLTRDDRMRRQLEEAIEQLREADAAGTASLGSVDAKEAPGS